MIRQLRQIALCTGVLVVSFAPLSMAQHRKVPRSEEPQRVRQLLVGFFAWGVICAMGALSVRAASLNVYQFTLGERAGSPEGNPFLAGSATPYLHALRAALTGTLVSHTVFTPANVAVWGPGGQFGGELYFLSIVEGLPRGALLEERKAVFFQFPGQSEQTFFDVTFYFPLEAYHHTPSTVADGFTRLHFDPHTGLGPTGTEGSAVDSATRTLASFASFARDFSNAQGFAGTANNPPLAITFLTGTQVRYEASYRVIAGTEGRDWTLLGQGIHPRGYRFGTGFTNLGTATILPVGSVRVTSTVVTMPPVCELAHASPASLWPPNHALVSIAIGGVTDPDDHQVKLTVTGVTQDEPVNGLGDGDTSPDAVLQEGGKVLLRAERTGTGNGRVYHVAFMADDGSGGQCTGVVTVCAPHDQGKGNACIDDGQQYNSLQP
jgi:hypothetical protein